MARKDPTFTDLDLLRLYCRNLDPAEKYRVMNAFARNLRHGEKICPDDPDERIDPCAWVDFVSAIMTRCEDLAISLPRIIAALVAFEVFLTGLSWVGPLGRLLIIIRMLVAYLITVLIYLLAIVMMILSLAPFIHFLDRFFCKGEKSLPLDKPPGMEDLPEDPNRRMDEIIDKLQQFWDWLSANPDEWEDGQPV